MAPPGAALRAFRVRPIGRCGLGERDDTDLVAAEPLVDGEARHERPEGSLFPCESVPSARTPTRRDCRQTKIRAGARVSFLFDWEEHSIRGFALPNHHLLSKLLESVIKQMRCLRQCVFVKMHS